MDTRHEHSSSETQCIAERAVRRVEKGTATKMVQSGLSEGWRHRATECYCYLRNVHDTKPMARQRMREQLCVEI